MSETAFWVERRRPGWGFWDIWTGRAVRHWAGIAQELIDRLTGYGGAIGHYPCPVHNSITPISPDWFKIVAVEMCREAGVEDSINSELLERR